MLAGRSPLLIEGVFGAWKSRDGEGARRGWIRLVGITATSLMTVFAFVHYNLRVLRKWAVRTGFDNGDPLLGHQPRKPTRDQTAAGAVEPPDGA